MAVREYKIGDRVIIEESNVEEWAHLKGKNVEGVVRSIVFDPDAEYPYLVATDTYTIGLYCKVKCLASDFNTVVNGFKVGDRVNVHGKNGTLICITMGDMFGIQFDDEKYDGHRCLGVKLKAGKPSTKCNCWWVKPCNVTKGEAPEGIGVWNGRAVCAAVYEPDASFVVGKIYKIKNGKLIDGNGYARPIANEYITKPEDLTAKDGYFANWGHKFTPILD